MLFATLIVTSNITDIFTTKQLEIENAKLQERLQLSHNLHDILGSSLVRSMGIITQSKDNLDNQQFLSMLKLFRDDLRQVIDSGSSTGAEVPETPILWGAPVRHRFSQIFAEIGIQCRWSFPDKWKIKPNALDCLTLQRVTEEALTNIIKHSQAQNVVVSLRFSDEQQIILEIEDDGVGFDMEAVKQSGISIGIRSMQIRLEKIQAEMVIESQSGQTRVRVLKSYSPHKTDIPAF